MDVTLPIRNAKVKTPTIITTSVNAPSSHVRGSKQPISADLQGLCRVPGNARTIV